MQFVQNAKFFLLFFFFLKKRLYLCTVLMRQGVLLQLMVVNNSREMRKFITGCLLLLLAMFSCMGNKTKPSDTDVTADTIVQQAETDSVKRDTLEQLISETPMPTTADELFDDFVFNFAANPNLQLQRIRFPLIVREEDGTDTISREGWQTEHFFMRQGYYTLLLDNTSQVDQVKDTDISHVAIEKIFLDKRSVKQYIFERTDGLWMMTGIKTMPLADNANADFLMFYEHFVTDSLFQAHSLNPVVEFVGPDPDNDDEQMEGIITDDTWPAFAPELPSKMIYNIVYDHIGHSSDQKVFLLRGIANGLELQMTFKRKDGRWKLTKLIT